jgi:hypothetical protein
MSAFLGISIWITLAMVLPGLVTIAAVYGALLGSGSCSIPAIALTSLDSLDEWVVTGAVVTVMITTQAVGILLESFLVKLRWLGPEEIRIEIPAGVDPLGLRKFELKPYEEYLGLYLLLAELRSDEDSHGHLQRALAQFFLSNNTLVSYAIALGTCIWQLHDCRLGLDTISIAYLLLLLILLLVTFKVVRIRFQVMAKALWAARRRRLEDQQHESSVGKPLVRHVAGKSGGSSG